MNLKVLVARRQREWSQAELATKIGINQSDLSRIEANGWIPPAEIRQRLAEALDTTPGELFEEIGDVAS